MWRRESYGQNVPQGLHDRSLARSAWDSAHQTSRPAGYGVISAGVRTDSKKHGAHLDEKYLWD
jgi:hypothetical protein